MTISTTTSTESRALELLGTGISPAMVASAIGVSESRISQLISDPEFSAQVATLRYENLIKHSARDQKYDALEDRLVDRMSDMITYMVKPFEILKAIQIINAAKRRGSSAPEAIVASQTVVSLNMPTTVIQNFIKNQNIQVNVNNQVVRAGEQDLITVQSQGMDALVRKAAQTAQERNQNDHLTIENGTKSA